MITSRRALACAAALSCLAWQSVQAGEARSGDLVITRAWSPATPAGAKVAGGYLTIENRGSAAERLTAASTALAAKTEIHEMAVRDGIMTMRQIEGGLSIPPGQSVSLAPGGGHLMLVGLGAPLHQGDTVPMTLSFEHAGDVKVALDVAAMGAQAPAADTHAEPATREPTATTADADESFFTHLHAVKAMANVTVSPGRAGPVEIAIQLEDADELPLAAQSLSVTLGNPEHGVAPVTAAAERVGPDQWRVRMSAPLSGRWSLGLAIGITASDTVNVASPILLR